MTNIVGTPIPKYVANQISDRQRILGKTLKDSKDIVWENGKTSWVRLASSVNIESQTLVVPTDTGGAKTINDNGSTFRQSVLGLNGYGGSKLAKELVLQGGAVLVNGSNSDNNLSVTMRSGITQTNTTSPSNTAAYGYGGTEFGIVPMPGIDSFSVKDYNNGTLREVNLEIIAHNRKQFEYLDTLYLRLGYTMFVEWGNTTYPINVDSNGNATYATPAQVASLSLVGEFLNQVSNKNAAPVFQDLIEKNREASYCNYDGFIGLVKNFSWELTDRGAFKISLTLISEGGVIESLKLNNQLEGTSYPLIDSGSNSSFSARETALGTFVSLATQVSSTTLQGTSDAIYPATKNTLTPEEQSALQLSSGSLYNTPNPPVLSCNIAYGAGDTNAVGIDKGGSTRCYYVHFGSLLEYVNQKLLSYDSDGTPNFVSIDNNLDTFVYSNGWSFSSDPTKFIVALNQTVTSNNGVNLDIKFFSGTDQPVINKFHDESQGVKVGRLMNIYLERDYVYNLIKNLQDPEDGNIYLNKFLDTILGDINVGLGNVNKIKYRVTDVPFGSGLLKKIQFYDEVTIYGKEKITGNVDYQLNLYGFDNNNPNFKVGSFVTSYGIKTEIGKRLQTQIAIGAQAGGQAVGYDSTAISKWNVGLVDRINPNKIDANLVKTTAQNDYTAFIKLAGQYLGFLKQLEGTQLNLQFDTTSAGEDFQINATVAQAFIIGNSPLKAIQALFQDFGEGIGYVAPNLNLLSNDGTNQFAPFQNLQSTFFSKALAASALSQNAAGTPFIGFLPINLTLTMDGISGIKIFNKLVVDSRFLPPNYGETLEFIITGIDHSFEGNRWTTSIQTISIPKLFAEAEVIFGSGTAIEEIVETLPIPPNNEDSFFVFNNVYNPDSPFASSGRNTTQAGQQVSINDILKILNQSADVQSKFRTFFESILDTYPKGYKFSINDIARPVDSTTGVGIASAHVYSVAIDLSVYDAKTGKRVLGLQQTVAGVDAWRKFGIVALAEKAGLEWGGTYSGSWKYDTVHFTALPGWAKYSAGVKKNLFTDLPRLKTLLNKTSKTQDDISALKSVDLRNYLLVEGSSVTTSPDRIRFRQWFKNNDISDYQ